MTAPEVKLYAERELPALIQEIATTGKDLASLVSSIRISGFEFVADFEFRISSS